jgi:hypothetical protein
MVAREPSDASLLTHLIQSSIRAAVGITDRPCAVPASVPIQDILNGTGNLIWMVV